MEKKRAILIGLVSIVLLNLAFCSGVQAAAVVVSVSPSPVELSQGDTFTIDITIDPKGAEVFGAQYDLYFDSHMLKALTQSQGTFLSQDGANTNVFTNKTNNTIGKIEYVESRIGVESGVINPGVLASISFEVIGTSGTSYLKLSNVKISDQNVESISTVVNGGKCIIGEVTGKSAVTGITVEETYQMMEEKPGEIVLLDVRTKEEYDAEHILEAKLIPLSMLEDRIGELNESKNIVVYSQSGIKGREAGGILVKHGFELVYNMFGGIDAWRINFPEYLIKAMPTPPSPVLSPSPSPTPAASSVVSPTPTPAPEGKWGLPGFEAVSALIGLLAISYFMLKRRRADKK